MKSPLLENVYSAVLSCRKENPKHDTFFFKSRKSWTFWLFKRCLEEVLNVDHRRRNNNIISYLTPNFLWQFKCFKTWTLLLLKLFLISSISFEQFTQTVPVYRLYCERDFVVPLVSKTNKSSSDSGCVEPLKIWTVRHYVRRYLLKVFIPN